MMTLQAGKVVGQAKFRSVHKDFYKGVYVPRGTDVAVSIRCTPEEGNDRGYSDHWIELGKSLDYTGQGGPPDDQTWNRWNQGLRNAAERRSPVHVFEPLKGGSPKTYRYWGWFRVSRWYEVSDEAQQRRILRFVIEMPD